MKTKTIDKKRLKQLHGQTVKKLFLKVFPLHTFWASLRSFFRSLFKMNGKDSSEKSIKGHRMYSKFQTYILEELDEMDDYVFVFLIPIFLEYEKGKKIRGEFMTESQNYQINDADFATLQKEVKELFTEFDLGLYLDISHKTKGFTLWEDDHTLLNAQETAEILSKKEHWIWTPKSKYYVIAEKEGDKVEQYFAQKYGTPPMYF